MEIEKDLNTVQIQGHYKKFIHDTYIGAHDLMNEDGSFRTATVTISGVYKRKIYDKVNRKQVDRLIIDFERGGKSFIVNATNLSSIEKIAKTPMVDKWKGTTIMLHVEQVKAGTMSGPAIRVKSPPKEK